MIISSKNKIRCCFAALFIVGLALVFLGQSYPAYAQNQTATALPQDKEDLILSETNQNLPFAYVSSVRITDEILLGFAAKSLTMRFSTPQLVLSSLNGWQEGIMAVGNHYGSPESWPIAHELGLPEVNARTMNLLKLDPESSSFLYTGADIANYAFAEYEERYNDDILRVGVLATAGVEANAMRASKDKGDFWEQQNPGTINLIILTNRQLTPAAMTRALITATEAKTAALEDLDIRSAYSGLPATGTGTDNIIIVSGKGRPADMSGGHTKMGELISRATYKAVTEAIAKQNNILPKRSIEQRLQERDLNIQELIHSSKLLKNYEDKEALTYATNELLTDPYYAGFMAIALTLEDSYERGQLVDTTAFSQLCKLVAQNIAGQPVNKMQTIINFKEPRPILQEATNAMLTGICSQKGITLNN